MTERVSSQIATEAQLLQMAVTGVISPKARKQFNKMVKKLSVEVKPVRGLCDPEE